MMLSSCLFLWTCITVAAGLTLKEEGLVVQLGNSSMVVDTLTVTPIAEDKGPEVEDLPPSLPEKYELTVDVWHSGLQSHFTVTEHQSEDRLALILRNSSRYLTCLVNLTTNYGEVIEGVICRISPNLPQSCFCQNHTCLPYIRFSTILAYITSHNATVQEVGVGAVDLVSWRVNNDDVRLEVTYTKTEGHKIMPTTVSLEGSGKIFGLPGGAVHLVYNVLGYRNIENTPQGSFPYRLPPGVFCPHPDDYKRLLPPLADQFSLTMETIIELSHTISYEKHHYDLVEKLVAYEFHPHLHTTPAIFFATFPFAQVLPPESFKIIHDFKTGIQYTLNEQNSSCTIQSIPLMVFDATPVDDSHIRLRHANELLSVDPDDFVYIGTRKVRGVECDVWIAEKGLYKGYYSTVEVYLSHENWTVEMEILNQVRRVPVGVSTYAAPADNLTAFSHVAHTHYYAYSSGHPKWHHFDISTCLGRINRLFLKLSLEVSYNQLVQFSLDTAKDSIRRAIAGISGVSPLRVTNLFVSSSGWKEELDVWFVLLEKPNVTGPVVAPRPQLSMADAYQMLRSITQKHDVTIKLDLGPARQMLVLIKRESLETTSETLHPGMRHKAVMYLRASYTAGSMAGLGFSMAVLGMCLGVFIGFLLWKHKSGIPYHVTD